MGISEAGYLDFISLLFAHHNPKETIKQYPKDLLSIVKTVETLTLFGERYSGCFDC